MPERTEEQRRKQREYSQRFYAKNSERVKGWVKRWQTERNPEGWEAYSQETRGGQPADRPRPEHCDLCAQPEAYRRRINYDHCHETGVFRGWICTKCNYALGWAKDDPALLRKMADYLEAAKAKVKGE